MGASKPKAPPKPTLTGELGAARAQAISSLQRQAAGKGPSVTREQLKAATERTLAAQLAAAQSRKPNSGTARNLIMERGETGRELAQAAATGAAQEAQGARSALIGVTEGDLNRQAGLAALEAQRQSQIAQQQNQMTGSLLGAASQIGSQAIEGYQANKLQEAAAAKAAVAGDKIIKADGASIFNDNPTSYFNANKYMDASDEDVKENKAPSEKKMKSFLDALSAKEYNYKPETGLDTKKKYGIMAQDLEKSEVGKSLVVEKNGVKHVDMNRGFSAILAAQAELNNRLNKVEKS